jgi:hypothetical protein
MVYKILGKDITSMNLATSYVIAISATGEYALINSTENLDHEIVQDNEVDMLLQTPEWKQPCVNCN